MARHRRPIHLVAPVALCCLVGAASAQGDDHAEHPFLKYDQGTEWDTRREHHIFAPDFFNRFPSGSRQPFTGVISATNISIIVPMIDGCATAVTDPERHEIEIEISEEPVPARFELIPGFQAGEQVGRWDLAELNTRQMAIKIRGQVKTFGVTIDEQAAKSIAWPEEGFPDEVASALQPQAYVESEAPGVVDLLNRWTSNNAQGPPPYLVAKAIAGRLQEEFQPSGVGFYSDHPARFAGVDISGAANVARSLKGTEADMAALLCALYRAAGLPARVVIGWDVAGSPGGRAHVPAPTPLCRAVFNPDNAMHAQLRTWVEFYLYDEPNDRGGWLPVDVFMLRQASSRMKRLDQPWPGFGGDMCFDHLVPITFHFAPPITAEVNATPMLWGWLATPGPPPIDQELILDAMNAVQRGGR